MIPHFSNPHCLLASTKITSRAEVFGSGEGDGVPISEEDESILVDKLMELIQHSFVSDVEEVESRSRKRRKVYGGSEFDIGTQDSVLFRLVSSSLSPIPLILMPKPPPPSITREPESEDTEVDAQERMQRAQSVAVDFAWVLQESQKIYPPFHKKLLQVKSPLPTPPPPVMTVQYPKPPRAMRFSESPPDPAHISTTLPLPTDVAANGKDHPLINIVISPAEAPAKRKRKRRGARR